MNSYYPDRWLILKIVSVNDTIYKVLGGWGGGYLGADSWRLNSGIKSAKAIDDSIEFKGFSGSTYVCKKGSYGATFVSAAAFMQMKGLSVGTGHDIISMDEEEALSLKWLA